MPATTTAIDGVVAAAAPQVYKLVLTGGPCSGKTTSQARISTFFENLGWRVYRVPETATTLFSGGIRFPDLDEQQAEKFQENLLKTMIAIETTFFELAEGSKQNCLIICDRGIMDAAAYQSKESFDRMLKRNNWNTVDLRDTRYNQVIHLITAASGAEDFYNLEDNPCRTEGLDLARDLDKKTLDSWVGHPYLNVIDNPTGFEGKLTRMLDCLTRQMGINASDRLDINSQKFKFLVNGLQLATANWDGVEYKDFVVTHNYLVSSDPRVQSRLRKRGTAGNWSYLLTVRRWNREGEKDKYVDVRRQISRRDYRNFAGQHDHSHYTIVKARRCFLWRDMYFQLDIYKKPLTPRCDGLVLLECFTTLNESQVWESLPPFLEIIKNVTGDPEYSMFNLSRKSDSTRNDPTRLQKEALAAKFNGSSTTKSAGDQVS